MDSEQLAMGIDDVLQIKNYDFHRSLYLGGAIFPKELKQLTHFTLGSSAPEWETPISWVRRLTRGDLRRSYLART